MVVWCPRVCVFDLCESYDDCFAIDCGTKYANSDINGFGVCSRFVPQVFSTTYPTPIPPSPTANCDDFAVLTPKLLL